MFTVSLTAGECFTVGLVSGLMIAALMAALVKVLP